MEQTLRFGPGWITVVAALLIAVADAPAAEVEIHVRDSLSGAPLDATLELFPIAAGVAATRAVLEDASRNAAPQRVELGGGRARVGLPTPMLARLRHPGHAELVTVLEPGPVGWTLWLTPAAASSAESADADAQTTRLHGTVRDAANLQPLAGATLWLEPLGLVARSGADGRYAFELPTAAAAGDRGELLRLHAEADGYPAWFDPAIPHGAGTVRRNIDLGAGPPPVHRQQDWRLQQPIADTMAKQAIRDSVDDPPLSIRVGFADAACSQTCCTNSCTHSCVFDSETYVRRGIGHEWIASWNQHALRAGTVAYRSYGAWHALNPAPGRGFDLCSSACCQVSGGTTSDAGDRATRATAGLLLQRNDAVFRAEYSAENNCLLGARSCSNADLSCGNGHAGSPATGWPCLADPVGLDQSCFGHGRGMSQWGTQRWSQSPHLRHWPWIVDHYYNAGGNGSGLRTATMTRVLAVRDAAAEPAAVLPGEAFDIVLEAVNRAGDSHRQVLIGASIRRDGEPFLSDPPNDRLLELPAGTSLARRRFEVPADAAPGQYALWVSLYLDIDEDGEISSNDLVQALLQLPAALQVPDPDAPPARIFADGFESRRRRSETRPRSSRPTSLSQRTAGNVRLS
jgi:hypothetical protein